MKGFDGLLASGDQDRQQGLLSAVCPVLDSCRLPAPPGEPNVLEGTGAGSFEETKPGDSRAARDFSPREPPPFRKRSGSAYSPNGRKGFRV